MAIALDGSATVSVTAVANVTLVTSNSNDVLIAAFRVAANPAQASVAAVHDNGPNLTWTKRKSIQYTQQDNTTKDEISVWYAVSPAPFNATITGNLTTATNATRATAWGVSGADTVTIFDPSASFPGSVLRTGSGQASTSLSISGISSNNANDMFFCFVVGDNGFGTITRPSVPSVFLQILATGTVNDYSNCIVSATQSNITETFSFTNSSCGAMIIDAIMAAGGISNTTISLATTPWNWANQAVVISETSSLSQQSWSWVNQPASVAFTNVQTLKTWPWKKQIIAPAAAVSLSSRTWNWIGQPANLIQLIFTLATAAWNWVSFGIGISGAGVATATQAVLEWMLDRRHGRHRHHRRR